MSKRLSGVVGMLVLAWTGSAWALGLGEIEAKSRLNQPLSAQIQISSSTPAELDSLVVVLASNEDFERAGIERREFLSNLKFELQGNVIRVRSKEIAREPFVTFLLDLRWKGGRLLREYTVLLDPPMPATQAPPAASAAPAQVAAPAPAPATPPPSAMPPKKAAEPAAESAGRAEDYPAEDYPVAEATAAPAAPKSAAAPVAGGSYGPVQPQETLWSIAYKLRPDPAAITMDQMQVALLNANPQAFKDGHLGSLLKGSVLRIPGRDEILSVDPVAAKAQVAAARSSQGAALPVRPTPVAKAEPAPAPVTAPKPAAAPKAAPEPSPTPAPVAKAEPAPAPAAKAEPAPAPAPKPAAPATAVAETAPAAPKVEATPPPSEPVTAPASAAVAEAPAETPAETPIAEPAAQAQAPAEPAEPVATSAPVIKKPKYEVDWTGFLERGQEMAGPYALPAAAGILVLVVGLLGFGKLRDKYAQWSYNRARRKPPKDEEAPDDTEVEATQANPEPQGEATQINPAMAATQAMDSGTFNSTQAMEAAPAPPPAKGDKAKKAPAVDFDKTMQQEPAAATTGGRAVDFDVTGQYASETVQINLDAGDPVSEAEFHRAYGLYDEAALLLKQAIEKDPARTDAKVKLAEIYFEASKATEFVALATELKSSLPEDEWQKIALMGSQLAPQEALFSGATASAGASVDLSFDEPAAEAPAPKPAAKPAPKAEPAKAADPDLLDFKFDEPAPAAAPAAPAAAKPAQADGDALEFDLESLSLEMPASEVASAAPEAGEPKADSLDLGDFDLGEPDAGGGESVSLEGDAGSGGDDASTKLDLARAYVDMGDNDMARGLLNEVLQQGNEQQKKEAGELLQRVQA